MSTNLSRAQDGLLKLLGSAPESRAHLVASMLRRDASEATSYWLQLVVSVGIATLGLVVGSAAVVIGAMLVAPLMVPIVGLAMGLASGSPFLVLRSAGRIAFSVVVVVGGAALITQLLPFRELNAEIAARTSPTVLDLITAAFCALIGVYAALRAGADSASTAAGTSISISLVPPLCVSGYGVGTGAWSITWGASLLFLTNMVAIVVIGTMAFVAAGFNRVGIADLERDELQKDVQQAWLARTLTRRLSRLFASRLGPALRFLMPFVLLGAVYVPLRRALDEVAWQVRVRASVREILAREELPVVQSRIRVERREVEVVVVFLGRTEDAQHARERMDQAIRSASGVTPRLEVLAVPDANAIAGLESSLRAPRAVETVAPPPPPPTDDEQLEAARARIHEAVEDIWPRDGAGDPLAIRLDTTESAIDLHIVHFGAELSADTLETLRRALSETLVRDVIVRTSAVPATPLTRSDGDLRFVGAASAALRMTAEVDAISVCVVRPAPPGRGRREAPADVELTEALDQVLAEHPRVTTTTGGPWSVRFVVGPCVSPPALPTTPEEKQPTTLPRAAG